MHVSISTSDDDDDEDDQQFNLIPTIHHHIFHGQTKHANQHSTTIVIQTNVECIQ